MNNVIIIGAGPAGLFAAKTILEENANLTVEIFEQGKMPDMRSCNADKGRCNSCTICDTLQGVGGAGLFSDGKLVLDLTSGGKAKGIHVLTDSEKEVLEHQIKEIFIRFDGASEFKEKPPNSIQEKMNLSLENVGLKIKFYDVLHMGTNNLQRITWNFVLYLSTTFGHRFKIFHSELVIDIDSVDDEFLVCTNKGEYNASAVVLAVGKTGSSWLASILERYNCKMRPNNFYWGFRLEMAGESILDLFKLSYDPKIYRTEAGRKVKMHCACRKSGIRYYRYKNLLFVGGHTPTTVNNRFHNSLNTNVSFNILVSCDKNKLPVEEFINAFRGVNDTKVIVQKLRDYFAGAATEDLGTIVPKNRYAYQFGNVRKIMASLDTEFNEIVVRFLKSLSMLYPDVNNGDNLIYAPVLEWDMDTVCVSNEMETEIANLFAIGDGAGLSQGIVYSAATGIIAARTIAKRFAE
jgi:uncharacterized FAD-dependent dehydrogenase